MKKLFLLFSGLILSVLIGNVSQAQLVPLNDEELNFINNLLEEQAPVKTVSLLPLDVTLGGISDTFLSGNIVGHQVLPTAETVYFRLVDEEGQERWSQNIKWNAGYSQFGKTNIPFRFLLGSVGLEGKYELWVEVLNEEKEPLAQGSQSVEFLKSKNISKIGKSSKMEVEENGQYLNISFNFRNSNEEKKVIPVLKVYERDTKGEPIYTNKGEGIDLGEGDDTDFFFDFAKPEFGGVYMIQVYAENLEEQKVSGALASRYVIKKDFGTLEYINVLPQQFLEEKEEVMVKFAGRSTVIENGVRIEFTINQLAEDESVIDTIEKTMTMNDFDGATFSGLTRFKTKKEANGFEVVAKIFNRDVAIGEKTYKTEIYKKPVEPIVEQQPIKNNSDTLVDSVFNKGIILWVIIAFAVLILIGISIYFYKKKHRILILVPLILSFGIGGSAQQNASTFGFIWNIETPFEFSPFEVVVPPTTPTQYSPYDTNPTRAELGFGKMYFNGMLYDGNFLTGELDTPPTAVNIVFSRGGTNHGFALPMGQFNTYDGNFFISGIDSYYFSFDLPPIAGTLTDGEWDYRLIFNHPVRGWIFHDTRKIVIDNTNPDVPTFTLKNAGGTTLTPGTDFTTGPVGVQYQCTDADSRCLLVDTTFDVEGNFCDNAAECNTTGTRVFEVCDVIGNCRSPYEELEIKVYDPVKPVLSATTGLLLTLESLTENGAGAAADNRFRAGVSDWDINLDDSGVLTTEPHDAHACGQSGSLFVEQTSGTSYCQIEKKVCLTDRGAVGEYDDSDASPICDLSCPVGTKEDATGQFCIPLCDDKNFPMCMNTCLSNGLSNEPLYCPYGI